MTSASMAAPGAAAGAGGGTAATWGDPADRSGPGGVEFGFQKNNWQKIRKEILKVCKKYAKSIGTTILWMIFS